MSQFDIGEYQGDRPDQDPMIRPFVLTGGRTATDIPVEALAISSYDALSDHVLLSSEQQSIVDLCRTPHAVAEISARLGLPLGVTRILVSDLQSLGVVYVSQVAGASSNLDLIGRLLDGIHRL
jgi:hypothetical protein